MNKHSFIMRRVHHAAAPLRSACSTTRLRSQLGCRLDLLLEALEAAADIDRVEAALQELAGGHVAAKAHLGDKDGQGRRRGRRVGR